MEETIFDFLEALQLAGKNLNRNDFEVNDSGCPHEPRALPKGKMAVYIFLRKYGGQYLKIGKIGPNSGPRFINHHYKPNSSNSNLAKSLLKDKSPDMKHLGLNENNIGEWIKTKTRRIDILIGQDKETFVLNFLEAFLHCIFKPQV